MKTQTLIPVSTLTANMVKAGFDLNEGCFHEDIDLSHFVADVEASTFFCSFQSFHLKTPAGDFDTNLIDMLSNKCKELKRTCDVINQVDSFINDEAAFSVKKEVK